MPRNNVLLMLSIQADPHPQVEVKAHEDFCNTHGSTYVITTQDLRGEEYDRVAFFGDVTLDNHLLATAVFEEFIPLADPMGQKIAAEHKLYRNGNAPRGSKGFIKVTEFRRVPANTEISTLNGRMTNGKELTAANLPEGPTRAKIIYLDRR